MSGTALAQRMEAGAAAAAQGESKSLVDELESPVYVAQIRRALPASIAPERFLRLCLTETRKNRKLLRCTRDSFLGAVMTAAQLGLEPDVRGLAYLIPRWSKKIGGLEATLLIGYKGYIDLARRSGTDVTAHVVYEADEFDWAYGTSAFLHHKPVLVGDRGAVIGAYAIGVDLATGKSKFEVLRLDQIEGRRARSTNDGFSPWDTDWDAMARKSAVRALASYLPQTVEFAQAVALDETVRIDHTLALEDVPVPEDDEDEGEQGDGIPDAELVDEDAGGADDDAVVSGPPSPASDVAGGPEGSGDDGNADVPPGAVAGSDAAPPAADVGDDGGTPPAPVAPAVAYRRWGVDRLRSEATQRNLDHDARIDVDQERDGLAAALALDDAEHGD